MKILITGGAGYLGSVLSGKLEGHDVTIFDKLMYREPSKGINYYIGDIRNKDAVLDVVKGHDVVIHLAAIVGDEACALNKQVSNDINYNAMNNIIEACNAHGARLLYASSCSVYGANTDHLHEGSYLNPLSLYAINKMQAEELIVRDCKYYLIFRMGTLFGASPRMRLDLVINLLTARAVHEGWFTIHGGEQWRPFLHVEDAADAFINACSSDKIGIYNIASFNEKLIDVGKNIIEITGGELNIDKTVSDKRDYKVSWDKAEKDLYFDPKVDFRASIENMMSVVENINRRNPVYYNHDWLAMKRIDIV